MSQPIIEVQNLSKRYRLGAIGATTIRDELYRRWRKVLGPRPSASDPAAYQTADRPDIFWALRDISFEARPGEVIGIIGRNGAGKSTLLKILSRITEPTTGRAVLRGRTASLLEVGTGFHPDLTGRANIFLNGAILGMTQAEIRQQLDEIIAFAEVEKFIDTPVKHYSSGMYVRLAFAVAAHLNPEILIVDEVLAVGDFAFQKKCLAKIEGGAKAGRTILFVSHNTVAVRSLCSRALFLDQGKVVADGDVNRVLDNYLSISAPATEVVEWTDPKQAPGDEFVRLKSVSVSGGGTPGKVDIQKDFKISVEYWVLQDRTHVIAAFHLTNSQDELLVTSGNQKSISAQYDPWVDRPYPIGLFRTSCTYPGRLFNDGFYRVTVYLNDASTSRHHVLERDVLQFEIVDTGFMREEYQGPWLGNLRLKLPWATEPVSVPGPPPSAN